MFIHIFRTRLKCLLRDKETVFWSMLFPLILAIFFNVAFSSLNEHEAFEPVRIAVVNDKAYQENHSFQDALKVVSAGEDRLFDLTEGSLDEAKGLLENGSIEAYVISDTTPKLVTATTGLGPSIAKIFLDSYVQLSSSVTSIMSLDPAVHEKLLESLSSRTSYTREVSPGGGSPNSILNYYYSLIAMACFYGAFFGNREIMDIQANLSPLAARVSVSPVHKLRSFIYSLMASLLIHGVEMLILILFLSKVIGVDFGNDTAFVVLTALAGSFTGVTFGAFVSSLVKRDEGVKTGVILAVSMTGSFLAGMMYEGMKYIVSENAPILSYLNPVNLLTDAFYSLYYYDTYRRYALNMGILGIFAAIFCTGTYLVVRRRKYASI